MTNLNKLVMICKAPSDKLGPFKHRRDSGEVQNITRIISAQLHEQLLEDVWVLCEESAVRLCEHLVHGLLRQVYQLPEELCMHTGTRWDINLPASIIFFFSNIGARFPLTSAPGPRHHRLELQLTGTLTSDPARLNEPNNMHYIYDSRTHMRSPTPSVCRNDSSCPLYKRGGGEEEEGKKGDSCPQQGEGEKCKFSPLLPQTCIRTARI